MKSFQSLIVWAFLIGTFVGIVYLLEYLGMSPTRVFSLLLFILPIWLPVAMFFLAFDIWLGFVRKQFILKNPRVTIEIILPQEIFKSPIAMELVINQLFQTAGADNHVQTYWDGKHPPTFALELISTEGQVRFCINTQARFKNLIEAQLYAQYPGIEVRELPVDYVFAIPEKNEGYGVFGFHFKLKKADAYPIRTYVDYGLDRNPKEEEKTDPISVTLESLGMLGKDEHMWLQILITANRGYDFKSGSLKKTEDWKAGVKAEITNILTAAGKRQGVEDIGMKNLTEGERDIIASMERSISKYAFDTKIRGLYVAKKESFNGSRIPALVSLMRGTDDNFKNAIVPAWRTDTDWPWWQDRGRRVTDGWKREEVEDYKKRTYTERNPKDTGMVLTTEELATLFHLPGSVVLNSNIQRIGSQRAEAPSNLPV